MMRFSLLLAILFIFSSPVLSQKRSSISGTISDSLAKKPVEFAAVALLSSRDSSLVKSGTSNFSGFFDLRNIAAGRYILKISHMSYEPISQSVVIKGGSSSVNLGNVFLTRKQVRLDEVVVTGKSTPIRIAKDTVEFNAMSYKPREQDLVIDILKKLPGVVVDKEGNITVNGQAITQVMLDGKKFFANDPKLATQNLPANIVDKIQVVDKKSEEAEFTKIDDGQKEKVINLKLKEDKKRGIFGEYRAGAGTNDSYDLSGRLGGFQNSSQVVAVGGYNNINRRGGGGGISFPSASRQGIRTLGNGAVNLSFEPNSKVQADGSYRFSYDKTDRDSESNRQNFDSKGTFNSDGRSSNSTIERSHSFSTDVKYKVDSTFEIVTSPEIKVSNGDSHEESLSHLYDANGKLVNSEERRSKGQSDSQNYSMDLLFKKRLGKPRQTLTFRAGARGGNSSSKVLTFQKNYYAFNDSTNIRNQNVDVTGSNANVMSRVAYTHPVGKWLTAEMNYRFDNSTRKSNNAAFDFNPATQKYDVENRIYSKDYKNVELKNALGLNLNFNNKKLMVNLSANANIINQDYRNEMGGAWLDTSLVFRNVSPSLYMYYRIGEDRNLSFRYSGNTRQPSVEQLHPVQNPSTPNSIAIGNPFLKQEFSNSFMLSYGYFNKQSFLGISSSLTCDISSNAIATKSYRDNLGKYYRQSVNVDGLYSVGANTVFSKSILDNKLHLSTTLDGSYSHSPSFFNQDKYFSNQLTVEESLGAFLTLDSFELAASCGYSSNFVSYDGDAAKNMGTANDRKYSTLTVTSSATARLPWDIEIESSIDLSRKYGDLSGGSDGSYLWNAGISKRFLKSKALSVSFIAFDILDKFRPYSRNVTPTYIEEVHSSGISQLFMFGVSYSIKKFKGAAPRQQNHSHRYDNQY